MQTDTINIQQLPHVRRALLAVLEAVSCEQVLSREYILKGGLALQLAYGGPRRSDDLDFTAARPFADNVTEEKNEMLLAFCEVLEQALAPVASRYGLKDAHVLERTLSVEIPALLGSVGYRDARSGDDTIHEAKMQITLSELICETSRHTAHGISFHAAALEDILADKLKAMLQQVTRNKLRPMDVYDVWYFTMASERSLNLDKLRQFLAIKAARWPEVYPPTAARFHDPELRKHSALAYDALMPTIGEGAPRVDFDDAFAGVLALVERLDLPEAG